MAIADSETNVLDLTELIQLPPPLTTQDLNHDLSDTCPKCEWILDIHFEHHITHIWTKSIDRW